MGYLFTEQQKLFLSSSPQYGFLLDWMVSFFQFFTWTLLTAARVCLYLWYVYMVMLLYCWVLTSAIQAIKRSDEDYMLTNVFVKLNQRKIQVPLERSLYLQSVTSELVSIEAITLPRCARPHFPQSLSM